MTTYVESSSNPFATTRGSHLLGEETNPTISRKEIVMTMKYATLNLGTIEALVNKLGGLEGVNRFLRGEITISEPARRWREQDGVIYITVTSDGTSGPECIKRWEKKGLRVSDDVKQLLLSPDFKPTKGVVYEIAILKGNLFKDSHGSTRNIRNEADKRKLEKPNAEVAYLISENFSNEEIKAMGLCWIAIFHEPIKCGDGGPFLLGVSRDVGCLRLDACAARPSRGWGIVGGFAFLVSQVYPQN